MAQRKVTQSLVASAGIDDNADQTVLTLGADESATLVGSLDFDASLTTLPVGGVTAHVYAAQDVHPNAVTNGTLVLQARPVAGTKTLLYTATSTTPALELDADQDATFAGDISTTDGSLSVTDSANTNGILLTVGTVASYTGIADWKQITTAATTNYDFIRCSADSATQFRVFGNGDAFFAGNIDAVAGGINLGATGAANLLDDYEEGTFSPQIAWGGLGVGRAYAIQFGVYTKVGNLVTITGRIELTSKGTSTGSAVLSGLPFISDSAANNNTPVVFRINGISFSAFPQGRQAVNTDTIILSESTVGGAFSTLNDTNFVDTSDIMFTCSYRTT